MKQSKFGDIRSLLTLPYQSLSNTIGLFTLCYLRAGAGQSAEAEHSTNQ